MKNSFLLLTTLTLYALSLHAMEQSASITINTKDNKKVKIDKKLLKHTKTLHDMLMDIQPMETSENETLYLPINQSTLKTISFYLQQIDAVKRDDLIAKALEGSLERKSDGDLIEIFLAADYLDFPILLTALYTTVIKRFVNKPVLVRSYDKKLPPDVMDDIKHFAQQRDEIQNLIYSIHQKLHTISSDTYIYNIIFSHDNEYIIASYQDLTIKIWSVKTGALLHTLDASTTFCISPNGKYLASHTSDTIKIWDIKSGKLINTSKGDYWDVLFSSDNNFIIATDMDETIKIINAQSGELIKTIQANVNFDEVGFSVYNELVAFPIHNAIKILNIKSGALYKTIPDNAIITDETDEISFSPDGKVIAAVTEEGIKIFDVVTGKLLYTLSESSFEFSPNGGYIITNSPNPRIWDVKSGKLIQDLQDSRELPFPTFSPNSKFIVCGQSNSRSIIEIFDIKSGKIINSLNSHDYKSISFSPNGKYIASHDMNDIIIWNIFDNNISTLIRGCSLEELIALIRTYNAKGFDAALQEINKKNKFI